jgi:TIR domain
LPASDWTLPWSYAAILRCPVLLQVYSKEGVFISHAGPQKGFALHLRTRLRDAGITAFVDERELLPGDSHTAEENMEAACRGAKLVVFVITRDFLRRRATMQELRWTLNQRQHSKQAAMADGSSGAALPRMLTVMYPTSVSPSWRVPELTQLLGEVLQQLSPATAQPDLPRAAERLDAATNDATVKVGELCKAKQVGSAVGKLLELYHQAEAGDGPSAAVAAQREAARHEAADVRDLAADLEQLADYSVIRNDSVAR